jgi:hypothetical protein
MMNSRLRANMVCYRSIVLEMVGDNVINIEQ